ncbi:imidazole glycerol phosphate synthase cyclase subunit [Thalassospiraceae bacterium LMO-JJ14]|nr:imidazole glycerol phosphate synthase cyclase subunit [Thalassospiraceae bacterium LMO-JJ14]
MLRKRIITVLTLNDGTLFRTKLFTPDYRYTLNFVDAWSVDEIAILDVTRGDTPDREKFFSAVADFAQTCFVPISVGGGIRKPEDVNRYMAAGADKVIVNTGALENPKLISDIANAYGSQCVVLSIDAAKRENGYEVMSHFGTTPTGHDPATWAKYAQSLGAGEILITAIERDGALQGYDLDLCAEVADAVSIPVQVLGGCGNWQHMTAAFALNGVSAACTQNIYHFTEQSIASAKKYLDAKGVPVRV